MKRNEVARDSTRDKKKLYRPKRTRLSALCGVPFGVCFNSTTNFVSFMYILYIFTHSTNLPYTEKYTVNYFNFVKIQLAQQQPHQPIGKSRLTTQQQPQQQIIRIAYGLFPFMCMYVCLYWYVRLTDWTLREKIAAHKRRVWVRVIKLEFKPKKQKWLKR